MKSRFNLGTIAMNKFEMAEASRHFHNVLQLAQGLGNRPMEARALREIGQLFHRQGDFIRSMSYYKQSLQLLKELKRPRSICRGQAHIAWLNVDLNNLHEALDSVQEGLGLLEGLSYPRERAFALLQLGRVNEALGDLDGALEAYQASAASYESSGKNLLAVEPYSGEARILLQQGELDQAGKRVEEILNRIEDSHSALSERLPEDPAYIPGLEGLAEPMVVIYTCWQVLDAAGADNAAGMKEDLQAVYRRQLQRIEDLDLRQAFMNNIRINKSIRAAAGTAAGEAP